LAKYAKSRDHDKIYLYALSPIIYIRKLSTPENLSEPERLLYRTYYQSVNIAYYLMKFSHMIADYLKNNILIYYFII